MNQSCFHIRKISFSIFTTLSFVLKQLFIWKSHHNLVLRSSTFILNFTIDHISLTNFQSFVDIVLSCFKSRHTWHRWILTTAFSMKAERSCPHRCLYDKRVEEKQKVWINYCSSIVQTSKDAWYQQIQTFNCCSSSILALYDC